MEKKSPNVLFLYRSYIPKMFSNLLINPMWKQNILLVHVMHSPVWHLWGHGTTWVLCLIKEKLGKYNEVPEWVQWSLLHGEGTQRTYEEETKSWISLAQRRGCWEYHIISAAWRMVIEKMEPGCMVKEISSSYKKKILCSKGDETLNKVAWRWSGISFFVDIQNLTNQSSDVTSSLLD